MLPKWVGYGYGMDLTFDIDIDRRRRHGHARGAGNGAATPHSAQQSTPTLTHARTSHMAASTYAQKASLG